jgi:hypothetical protein
MTKNSGLIETGLSAGAWAWEGGWDDVTERCLATFLGSPTLLLTVPQLFTAVTTEVAVIIIFGVCAILLRLQLDRKSAILMPKVNF